MLGVWFMRGAVRHGAAILDPAYAGEGWHPIAAGDMNQDGRADLIFKHTSGLIGVWLMNGAQLSSASLMQPNYLPSSWEVKAAGDFNQNGGCDLLLESTDGTLAMWFMNGLTLSYGQVLTPSMPGAGGWHPRAAGDFNSDGNADIVFQEPGGACALWLMSGSWLSYGVLLDGPASFEWGVKGVTQLGTVSNDYDQDGLPDLMEITVFGTSPQNPDTDGDQLDDYNEVHVRQTDPRNPDTDGDGLGDGFESGNGTDPKNPDSNNNSVSDGEEYNGEPLIFLKSYQNAATLNWTSSSPRSRYQPDGQFTMQWERFKAGSSLTTHNYSECVLDPSYPWNSITTQWIQRIWGNSGSATEQTSEQRVSP